MTTQPGYQPGADEQADLVYQELRRIAAAYMRRERHAVTLQATGLVHEAYLRLAGTNLAFADRNHFIAGLERLCRQSPEKPHWAADFGCKTASELAF